MGGEWHIRRYRASDADDLARFTCANHGKKWEKDAQRVIREDFPEIAADPTKPLTVFVAVDANGALIGVIGFGPDQDRSIVVHSMGVALHRQREGLGTVLKLAAMAECAALYGRINVASTVHRRNNPMKRVNEKLQVASERDPEDAEYLLTGVIVEAH